MAFGRFGDAARCAIPRRPGDGVDAEPDPRARPLPEDEACPGLLDFLSAFPLLVLSSCGPQILIARAGRLVPHQGSPVPGPESPGFFPTVLTTR